jgi:hypothetical protein
MCDNVPIYHHNQSQLKRVLYVAVMQQCDKNTTITDQYNYKYISDN